MLEKQHRLRKNKEFGYIYKKGESVFSKTLSLFYVKTKKIFKIGFSINNKIGNSVVRHRIKRRLAHIIKVYLPKLNPNYNYIIMARSGVELLTFEELKKNIDDILRKSKKYVEI